MNVTTEFHYCSAVSCNYGGKTREIIITIVLFWHAYLINAQVDAAYGAAVSAIGAIPPLSPLVSSESASPENV